VASAADIDITHRLKAALALIDVTVLDHFIVGGDVVTSMAEQGDL
ncbi:MAG: JAB domain-containing protein, partial [Methylococcaceae bacterium]